MLVPEGHTEDRGQPEPKPEKRGYVMYPASAYTMAAKHGRYGKKHKCSF